jgi:hypothetical protein
MFLDILRICLVKRNFFGRCRILLVARLISLEVHKIFSSRAQFFGRSRKFSGNALNYLGGTHIFFGRSTKSSGHPHNISAEQTIFGRVHKIFWKRA